VRFQLVKQLHQIYRVGEIAVVQEHPDTVDMRISVKMIDSCRIKCARAANDSMNLVPFLEQKVGKVTPILTCDAGDERFFHSGLRFVSSPGANSQLKRGVLSTVNWLRMAKP